MIERKSNKRGCRKCKSICGVDGCHICEGKKLCTKCINERQFGYITKEEN